VKVTGFDRNAGFADEVNVLVGVACVPVPLREILWVA
jgi:hypothetical protein